MSRDRELLESLRDEFKQLRIGDEDGLSRLDNRGRVLVRNIFGEDSDHFKQFTSIAFHSRISSSSDSLFGSIGESRPDRSDESAWRAGHRETVNLLDSMIFELQHYVGQETQPEDAVNGPISKRVFVVHGHDEAMRESVARVLQKLGLDPVILHEQEDRGRTLIEKFHDYSDVGFAVVLLSPDDTGYLTSEGSETAKLRARQNVIFELGFFLGRLDRANVVALHRGGVEIPSDYAGVLFKPYDSSGVWQYQLTKELRASGYEVSSDDL